MVRDLALTLNTHFPPSSLSIPADEAAAAPATTAAEGGAEGAPPSSSSSPSAAFLPLGPAPSPPLPFIPTQYLVLPDGTLNIKGHDGSMRVLHSDGTVSQRCSEGLEEWVYEGDLSDAKGWIRTLPDGTR